jgi:hypothetical protein
MAGILTRRENAVNVILDRITGSALLRDRTRNTLGRRVLLLAGGDATGDFHYPRLPDSLS